MNVKSMAAVAVATGLLAAAGGYQQMRAGQGNGPTRKPSTAKLVPYFEYDETFPKPLPNNWAVGTVVGIHADTKDNHVFIAHRPETLRPDELEAEKTPPRAECCKKAPHIIEFDYAGNLVQAWGGDGEGYDWPTPGAPSKDPTVGGSPNGMHSVFLDDENNIWLTATGPQDGQILKFTRNGKFLLQFGGVGKSKGSNDTENLKGASGVKSLKGEIFISDGYGNRRVVVLDQKTGKYKRHWGAYGKRPDDTVKNRYDANIDPQQFATPHGIGVSDDGYVYLADRNNSRVQVFKTDGTYVAEQYIERHTSSGSVFGVAISHRPEQKWIYIPDGRNERIWILDRKSLEILGNFGCPGHAAGCITTPHSIDTDAKGNIYIGETWEGKRVQRFLYKGTRAQ
jgi:DNA-binding beta-propeller fold protein YncE